jgi:hypothetical protein
MAVAMVGSVNGIRHAIPAEAVPGSLLRTITVTPTPACPVVFPIGVPVTVGVGFDGTELLVSCTGNEVITRVDPATGANLGSYAITGIVPGEGIGAISWDASVPMGQLWVATARISPQKIYRIPGTTLNKGLGTGVASFAFAHPAGGGTIVDGLAFDGTDSTIWMSPDVSDTIYHYTELGVLIGSKSGLTAQLGGFGNSGIAIANANTIYLANDGGSQIYSADKPAIATTTLFATVKPFRLEDLECDNVDFAPLGSLWSKDAYDWILRAFEVPAGQCAQGGVVDQAITAKGTTFSATEGQSFSGTVATVTDGDPMDKAAEYSATINWGDGSPTSPGTVTGPDGGPYSVNGTHTYAEEGTYTVKVHVTDSDSTNTADATSTAKVGDAALTSMCAMPPVTAQAYTGPTATFKDSSSTGTLSDFSATIKWGDATTTPGTIAGGPGLAPYTVSGSHTYTSTGPFTVTTTINDIGGSTTTATCQVLVFAFPTATGAFVIGDLADPLPIVGDSVTWWSSQWAQLNPMSGGPAPASMKGFAGFEDNPLGTPRTCGSSWTTDTGNATPPPASVPEFMGLLVSSTITQNGSVITGNIKQVVIVHNNPGYAPDPGHTGSGTIVAIICLS